MTERLLQFIWQFQYFNASELFTADAEPITIIFPGTTNSNQGPDFLDAKIKVGDTIWAGNIELHVAAADWKHHQHGNDKNFRNVILHVVWKNDKKITVPFPVLELESRVSKILLNRYDELMHAATFIPCEKNIQQVPAITWVAWKERLLVERLQQKSQVVFDYLAANNNHWEETFWWLLAKNFGVTVNSSSFEAIARSLPLTVLAKHKNQIHQVEALLFGQASLLVNNFNEDYPQLLQREYAFLQKKYSLLPIASPVHFLRMRPSNFPTIRLAQLAMLVHHSHHLFSTLKEVDSLKEAKALLAITANDYWHYHYRFDEESTCKQKHIGIQMVNNILINTIVPILFAYGHHHKEAAFKERALQWLEEMAAEKNTITKGFEALGIQNKNAFDSQALIQLKKNYCNTRRCLECAVGNKLLKTV